MSFSGSSPNKAPVKRGLSLNNLDGGGDVRVAYQDHFGVNVENSAQAFDSDLPSNSHQEITSPPPEQDVTFCTTQPGKISRRLSERVARLFNPRPTQNGGVVALETRTEDVCPPDVVQGTLSSVDERSSTASGSS
ncbi:hypothetical protein K443DRAFT_7403 [Laccaria amethystina LaAM-08-1]|uniref:Uncharacterized protein n=1 Tax=Laccaria amethystina LaAM-08-1 TaxID=1095629 RepID=A0A0C9XGW0_9AGAR|nr:hypothetical protein K443DRAFT_7403 [Laccaria amethystina LaAM-08-1]